MDDLLVRWMSGLIDDARAKHEKRGEVLPGPTDQLRLMFAGYNGCRNTGADVRVEEMLRQIRHLYGAERIAATVFSFIPSNSREYFGNARQVPPGSLFPRFLAREVPEHHGVIACEGSTFKSQFTDLLTVLLVGAMGMASAHDLPAIAYGAEAGHMNRGPKEMTRKYCKESLIITRNDESRRVLKEIDLESELGTDTAWTFSPLGPEYARQELKKVGWRGEKVLVVCPVNPFWWPVKVSLTKAFLSLFGFFKKSHYGEVFFFTWNKEVERKYAHYLDSLARAVDDFRKRTGTFVIVAASEELDNFAMRALSERLGQVPTFSSTQYSMHQLVSIFRASDMMLSSRFHAILTSMAGGTASAGVTMDERISNLMRERGHDHLRMSVNDPDLEGKAIDALNYLHRHGDQVAEEARRVVSRNLRVMSGMGKRLVEFFGEKYPNFAPAQEFRSWEDYLPPLGPELHALLERHAQAA